MKIFQRVFSTVFGVGSEPSWGDLRASWKRFSASWGRLGPSWRCPWAVLETSWGVLEASWGRILGWILWSILRWILGWILDRILERILGWTDPPDPLAHLKTPGSSVPDRPARIWCGTGAACPTTPGGGFKDPFYHLKNPLAKRY